MFAQVRENFQTIYQRRALVRFLSRSRREMSLFRTYLGRLWLLLVPLGNILVYYLLLTVVFRAGPRYGVDPFIFIMMGLSHYFILRRAVAGACSAFISQRNLLMQVNIEPLVFYAVAFHEAVLEFLTFIGLFFLFMFFFGITPPLGFFVYYPVGMAILLIFSWSLGLLSATINVFLRDFQYIVNFGLRLLLYASPILYAVGFIPEEYVDLYMLNPLATVFGLFHAAFFGAEPPGTGYIVYAAFLAVTAFICAHGFYNYGKKYFTKLF